MLKGSLLFLIFVFSVQSKLTAQCNTTTAKTCVCVQNGQTDCDLLPDMIVGRPPLTVQGSNGIIEYSQTGNGSNDGRLRISVSTPNMGYGPLEVRADSVFICGTDTFYGTAPSICPNGIDYPKQLIKQRVYHKTDSVMSYYDRFAGTMTYHPSHGHMHVDNWGVYTLRTATSNPDPLTWPIIGTGAKLAFCLMDYGTCSYYNGHCVNDSGNTMLNADFPNFGLGGGIYGCSNVIQGISSGYTDIYYQGLDGMFIQIPPGTCNGLYYIVVQLDPNNNFLESDESNNVISVPVLITQQTGNIPVITASGPTTFCTGKNVTLVTQPAQSYLWSNGATTQSIIVNTSGTYSVTVTSAGCANLTVQQPVTVNVIPFTASATATPNQICGSGNVVLDAMVTQGTTTLQNVNFSNNNLYVIPDNNSNGVASSVNVSNIIPATLYPGSVVKVKVNISHTYLSDLKVSLISPSGQNITLSLNRGGSGDNFTNTYFSMTAATAIASGTPPFTGTFIPDGNLNTITGNANGTWFLKVIDNANLDTGSILNFTLTLQKTINNTYSYSWLSNPAGFTSNIKQPTVTPTVPTNYTVTVNDGLGCTATASTTVAYYPLPSVSISGLNTSYQVVDPVVNMTASPTGGTFSGNGVSGSTFNPALAGIGGPYNITYSYTDSHGCFNADTNPVNVTASTYNCSVPQNLSAVIMTSTKVKIKWKTATAPQFRIRYKNLTLNTAFKYKLITGTPNILSGILKNLAPATNYRAEVQSVCNGIVTAYSSTVYFTTPAARIEMANLNASLYPNPAADKITLNFTSEENESTAVKIFDVAGKLKMEFVFDATEGENQYDFYSNELPSGMYFVTLTQSNAISNLKFIKK